jgi:hypothetical protein
MEAPIHDLPQRSKIARSIRACGGTTRLTIGHNEELVRLDGVLPWVRGLLAGDVRAPKGKEYIIVL